MIHSLAMHHPPRRLTSADPHARSALDSVGGLGGFYNESDLAAEKLEGAGRAVKHEGKRHAATPNVPGALETAGVSTYVSTAPEPPTGCIYTVVPHGRKEFRRLAPVHDHEAKQVRMRPRAIEGGRDSHSRSTLTH